MPTLVTRGAASAAALGATGNFAPAGQQAFTSPGTYTWIPPDGVFFVSVVAVGGGGCDSGQAGSGGSLGYKNNIRVTPGVAYTVVVGIGGRAYQYDGGASSFSGPGITTLSAPGGINAYSGLTPAATGADGGGQGGAGGGSLGGGGGAGGYSGNGGDGGPGSNSAGGSGSGGGGGGGGSGQAVGYAGARGAFPGASGGGVGILGEGSSGAGGQGAIFGSFSSPDVPPTDGAPGSNGSGGLYGAGTGAGPPFPPANAFGGAVRIIWSGTTTIVRAFPSTNTGDL